MQENSQSFDWEELLVCISDKRVIPVIGKELLVVSVDGREVLLETFLASRLSEQFNLPQDKFLILTDSVDIGFNPAHDTMPIQNPATFLHPNRKSKESTF